MRSIHIKASREYDVLVERGLLDRAGELLREVSAPGMAAIVSDDTVYALYGERTVKALEKAGYRVHSFTFPAGEGSKNLSTYADVLHFLGEHRFSRSDVVVALGGGVVGDLAGFAAATYQRGMGFAQIPTTLLAAVDSSVGGKTAVDLPTGKNQAGSFYQPCIVICDPNTLETLPEEQYRCGCAEIIKYSMLGNAAFFEELYKTPVREQYEHVIEVCVQMKRDIVGADEYDLGRRRTLNLGHTFGHAVEQCSDFSLLHGEAVAIGMATVTRAAVKRGICGEETLARLLDILHRYGLPTETGYELDKLYEAELVDKKISGRQDAPHRAGKDRSGVHGDDPRRSPARLDAGRWHPMKRTIIPGARTGRVRIPASKSQAHRLLICAALGEEETEVVCDGISADIAATAKCLSALGAKIEEMETGFLVSPIKKVPEGRCDLYCGESGSTLRFLLPIVGALGAQAVFHREGRLPQRPLAPLDSVLKEHGMTLREDGDLLYCSGQLIGGNYTIAGNVSSQYISGLLMALPLLIRDSLLTVSGPLESAAYVAMTGGCTSAFQADHPPNGGDVGDSRSAEMSSAEAHGRRGRLVEHGVLPLHGCAVERERDRRGAEFAVLAG